MASWQEQVAAAHQEVIDDFKAKFKQMNSGPSMIEGIKAFCASVDWTERWLIALVVCQAALFISAIVFRKRPTFQAGAFFSCMALVFNAERINRLAAKHWQAFASQDYFQPQGIFISAVLSAPLVLTMFVILINYLIELAQTMVAMKRKELIYKAKQRQRDQQEGSGGGAGAGKQDKKTK